MKIEKSVLQTYSIILPSCRCETERFAAEQLAEYIEKITSVKIPLVEKICGPAFMFEKSEDPAIKFDGFRIAQENGNIKISAVLSRGILNCVYTLLAENNCRWCWMGDENEIISKQDFLTVNEGVTNPDIEFRGVCIFSVTREEIPVLRKLFDFLGKNRFNLLLTSVHRTEKEPDGWKVEWMNVEKDLLPELQKRDMILNISEHSGRWFFPVSLFEKHPEWFAMNKDGKCFSTGQICYGNQEAVEYLTNAYVNYAKDHPEVKILGTWPEDGYGFCQCEKCRQPGTVIKAVNHIARALAKVRPDLMVEYLSYTKETSDVPPDVLPEKNIITLVANTNVAKEWKRKSDLVGAKGVYRLHYHITDNTAERANLPLRTEKTLEDVREMLRLGLRGIIPFYIGTDTWWRSNFNLYFLSRFCWDSKLEADTVLRDLCSNYYPTAEEEMFSLFKALVDLPRVNQFVPPPWKLWQYWPTLETDYDGPIYDTVTEKFKEAHKILADARTKGHGIEERHFISAEKFIDFQQMMYASWHCRALGVKAFRRNDAAEVKVQITEAARLEQAMKDAVLGTDEKNYGVAGAWIDYQFFIYWRIQLDKQLLEMRTEENKKPFVDMNPEVEFFLPVLLNNLKFS